MLNAAACAGLLAVALAGCTGPPPPAEELTLAATPAASDAASLVAALRVHYVDVGQGDGAVWQLPGGGVVVYDCGPPARSADENPVVDQLRRLGFARGATIHTLIASHGHLDHVGGCEEVLAEYQVLHLYEAWYEGRDAPASYAQFRAQLQQEGGVLHVANETPTLEGEVVFRPGDAIALPEAATLAGARATLLWPGALPTAWEDIASSSLVVQLTFGEVAYCFQGDIEQAQEETLRQSLGRGCDVYLAGHHGSRHASGAEWLAAMRPRHAVASFGANTYGHPTAEALCRIQEAGAVLHATHRLGTITIATTGARLSIDPDSPETQDYCQAGATYWGNGTDARAPKGAPPGPPAGLPSIGISEVEFDPPGHDTGANLVNEWVEVRNDGPSPIALGGWKLKDAAAQPNVYRFPSGFVLDAGSEVKVRTGQGASSKTDLYWGRSQAVWDNDGDVATLTDAQGNVVDQRPG